MEEAGKNRKLIGSSFLKNAKATYPSLVRGDRTRKRKKQIIFSVDVPVPKYEETRKVQIIFEKGLYDFPLVFSDGSNESKHRYEDGSLCMWYPNDSKDKKWVYKDGLLALIGHIQLHLFREAYWREFGIWVGLEVGH